MPPSSPQPPPWTPVPADEAERLNDTPTMRALGYSGPWLERVEVTPSGRRIYTCRPGAPTGGDHG